MKGKVLISLIATGLLATSLSFAADNSMEGGSGSSNDTEIGTDNGMGSSSSSDAQGSGTGSQNQNNDSGTMPDNATGDDY